MTPSNRPDPITDVRAVLRANTAFTIASAIALTAAAAPIGDLLGTGHAGWIRVVGLGLAVFAVDVLLVARAHPDRLVVGARSIAAADVGWVLASAVTVAAGWYSTTGTVVVAAVAAIVGGFAVAELRSASRAAGVVAARDAVAVGL